MVVGGLWGLLVRRPSPEFNPVLLAVEHWPYLAGACAAGGIFGLIWTRSPVQSFMLALGTGFVFCGSWFFLNSHLPQDPPEALQFFIQSKKDEYVDQGLSGGYRDHVLYAQTLQGQSFRFSTHASHISMDEWNSSREKSRNSYIEVIQHPGAFGLPWWEIRGLQN